MVLYFYSSVVQLGCTSVSCPAGGSDEVEICLQDAQDEQAVRDADKTESKIVHAIVKRVGKGTVTATLWGSQRINEEVHMSFGSYKLYWSMECDRATIQDRGIVSDWASHLLSAKDESTDKVAVGYVLTALRMAYDVMQADVPREGQDRK